MNTELKNPPSSRLTKHSTPARGKKILENTKQANFISYFMISVTDANLRTHPEM